jgi:hypothetical protein
MLKICQAMEIDHCIYSGDSPEESFEVFEFYEVGRRDNVKAILYTKFADDDIDQIESDALFMVNMSDYELQNISFDELKEFLGIKDEVETIITKF